MKRKVRLWLHASRDISARIVLLTFSRHLMSSNKMKSQISLMEKPFNDSSERQIIIDCENLYSRRYQLNRSDSQVPFAWLPLVVYGREIKFQNKWNLNLIFLVTHKTRLEPIKISLAFITSIYQRMWSSYLPKLFSQN